MQPVRYRDIEVDRCVRCGGLWFDLLEHEDLKKLEGSEAIDTGPTWLASMHNEQGHVFCPRDGTPMVRMVDPAQPHIWFESCSVCHGTFFDAGEFRDFRERTLAEILQHQRRERPS